MLHMQIPAGEVGMLQSLVAFNVLGDIHLITVVKYVSPVAPYMLALINSIL